MATGGAYRRGTIVGLTVAEIFMLVSFILIVAVLMISQEIREEHQGTRPVPGVNDANTLLRLTTRVETLSAKSENLERELTEARAEVEKERGEHQKTRKERDIYRNEASRTRAKAREQEEKRRQAEADADEFARQLDEARQRGSSTDRKLDETSRESKKLEEALGKSQDVATRERSGRIRAEEDADELTRQVIELKAGRQAGEEARKAAEERASELERELAAAIAAREEEARKAAGVIRDLTEEIKRNRQETAGSTTLPEEKGTNPPCWYRRVPKEGGGTREKPIYVVDIAVYNASMVLGRRAPPAGGADRGEVGTYAAEAERLGVDRLAYGVALSDSQVREQLSPLRNAGAAGRVRSYACIFYARVWDLTSREAKARWKRAHEQVLQTIVGTYLVQEDPWPH